MTQHLSHWELQQNSQNIWHSINCMNGRAEVIKHMGCWMLEIKFDTGKVHVSSHNTRNEAMREAEMRACWEVEFVI
jgi:hypothetical protein